MSIATMNNSNTQLQGMPIAVPPVVWWLEQLPVAVLILSITFLQGYSLVFWHDLLGRAGWGISAGILRRIRRLLQPVPA